MEALDAGDYKSIFVLAQPQKIPRHNFYEFIWLLKTGLPRYVSIETHIPKMNENNINCKTQIHESFILFSARN